MSANGLATTLVVNAVPLVLVDGELRLGPAPVERVAGGAMATASSATSAPTTWSIHWGRACDVLDADQVGRLIGWTRRQLRIANESL